MCRGEAPCRGTRPCRHKTLQEIACSASAEAPCRGTRPCRHETFTRNCLLCQRWANVPSCMQAVEFAKLKQHAREECSAQRRDHYVPSPFDTTPCYYNENTCHEHFNSTGMGTNITITYDWKHLIYEDYDRWLYNKCAATSWLLAGTAQALGCLWFCSSSAEWILCHASQGGVRRAAQTTSLSALACMTASMSLRLWSTIRDSSGIWWTILLR